MQRLHEPQQAAAHQQLCNARLPTAQTARQATHAAREDQLLWSVQPLKRDQETNSDPKTPTACIRNCMSSCTRWCSAMLPWPVQPLKETAGLEMASFVTLSKTSQHQRSVSGAAPATARIGAPAAVPWAAACTSGRQSAQKLTHDCSQSTKPASRLAQRQPASAFAAYGTQVCLHTACLSRAQGRWLETSARLHRLNTPQHTTHQHPVVTGCSLQVSPCWLLRWQAAATCAA